jgi:hypothetical protein
MGDDRKAGPVSGEIMTAGVAPAVSRGDAGDITEAEFETLPGAPVRRATGDEGSIATGSAPIAGMDVLRERAEPVRSEPRRGGPLFWATGVALIALAFWVSGGHGIVRDLGLLKAAPVSALRIEAVSSRVDLSGERPLLFIDGGAANDGSVAEPLPPLDILVSDNDGKVTRYRLGMNGRVLAPGERYAFSSRLDVPKNGVRTVTVSFAD